MGVQQIIERTGKESVVEFSQTLHLMPDSRHPALGFYM